MSAILESRGVSRQWRKSKRDKGGGKTKSREVQELPDGLSEASWFSSSGRVIPGWDPAVDPTLKGNGVFDPDAHYESNTTSPAGPLSAADTTSGSSAGSATSEDGDLPRAMIAADGSASDAGAVHFSADDAVASARLQQWVTQGSQEEETRNTVTCSPPTANKTWAKVTNPSPAPLRVDALERDAEIKALQVSVDVEIKSEMTICEQQSGDAHPHFSVLESLQRALHAERDARDTAVSAGIAVARAESFDELREMANGVATEAATRVFWKCSRVLKAPLVNNLVTLWKNFINLTPLLCEPRLRLPSRRSLLPQNPMRKRGDSLRSSKSPTTPSLWRMKPPRSSKAELPSWSARSKICFLSRKA